MLFSKWLKKSPRKKIKKQNVGRWNKKKKSSKKGKKKQACPGEPRKPRLISQTYNPLNYRLGLNQKAKYPTN